MRKVISSFRIGQVVQAEVKEIVARGDLIVEFQGDLLRIKNHTRRRFRGKERIQLVITAERPLAFKLYSESDRTGTGGFRTIV